MITFLNYITEEHVHGDFIRGEDGKPVSYYHGTRQAFSDFKPAIKPKMQLGFGMHFTPNADKAEKYTTKEFSKGNNPNIHKVHLRAKNVLDTDQMYHKDMHPKHFALHQALYKGTGRKPYVSQEGNFCVHPDATNPARAAKLIQHHGFDAVKYTATEPGHSGGRLVKKDQYPAISVFHPGQVHSAFKKDE